METKCEVETPDFSHLKPADFEHVYEPAEDTFLLLDGLQKEAAFIRQLQPSICVEVGCGSGIIISALSKLINQSALCIATDRNPYATHCTKRTAQLNLCQVEVMNCDLLTPLERRLQGSVDILIFNPPYVVTPSNEMKSSGIEASWAGGADGREVTDRLLPLVPNLLSQQGVMYLVAIRENKPEELMTWMSSLGLDSSVVLTRRAGPEHLYILKFYRDSSVR
ncbi:methyltransferase N6AMT1-like isoform X2 [Lytechinus pictus]